jgi:branched-chain amino acid aminotransferase
LIRLDKDWIPTKRGYSLYIRPTLISMTNQIKVAPAEEAKLFVICSPSGSYFTEGFEAISIICSENHNKSSEGRLSSVKIGSYILTLTI